MDGHANLNTVLWVSDFLVAEVLHVDKACDGVLQPTLYAHRLPHTLAPIKVVPHLQPGNQKLYFLVTQVNVTTGQSQCDANELSQP